MEARLGLAQPRDGEKTIPFEALDLAAAEGSWVYLWSFQ